MRLRNLIALAACAVALAGVAAPASAAEARPAASPAASATFMRGWIDSNKWCMNAPQHLRAGDGVFMAPCNARNGDQSWLCGQYKRVGFCSPVLAQAPLDLGQQGRSNSAMLVGPRSRNHLISFVQVTGRNNFIFALPTYSRRAWLAIPRIRVRGHSYWLHWIGQNSHYTYVWHTQGWNTNESVRVTSLASLQAAVLRLAAGR